MHFNIRQSGSIRILYYLFASFILVSCIRKQSPAVKHEAVNQKTTNTAKETVKYTGQQLEAFLDSVGRLPVKPLTDKETFYPDSVFKNQLQPDSEISAKDFISLKAAARQGVMRAELARRIFNNKEISDSCNEKSIFLTYKAGMIPVVYYPFDKDKHKFNEFALCIGDPGHCPNAFLYFFKGNRIIARHDYYNRYDTELQHYKDNDGKTIVYYVKEFSDGSGEWWNNYFFYKYDNNKLIPVLDELQNGNTLGAWRYRPFWLESFIQKTNPLTIKMVYNQYLPDTGKQTDGTEIINDSTLVRYTWDEKSKTLQGQYNNSKISKAQILSYDISDNELLFINAYYLTLKNALHNKKSRKAVLDYLGKIKNDSKF